MKRIAIAFALICALCPSVMAQDITLSDTLWLRKATHIDYDVAAWDTVFVDIMRGDVQVERIGLVSNGKGRWSGYYLPTYDGNFVAEYNAVYSGDTTIEETYFTVLDTTAFQGAAAGLTADGVVDEFEARGYAFGSGVFACSVSVRDSSLTAGIPGVKVHVRNAAETATVRWGTTNGDGIVVFGIDSLGTGSTYKLWLQNLAYNFTMPETLDVRSDSTWTYYGIAFDWGSPPPDSQVSIVGQIFNPFLDSLSGIIVSARLYVPFASMVTYLGFPISPFTVSDTTDVSGRFRLDLLPNDILLPDSTLYIWNFKYPVSWGGYFTPQDMDTTYIEWQAAELDWSALIGR